MTTADPDEHARRLAAESLAGDDPTGWFERLYVAAADGVTAVPWDRGAPHKLLVEWAGTYARRGGRALVVGCGLGEDAEYVAGLGFDTVAFDISATAVATARRRFPGSPVRYLTADLLDPPAAWERAFDLVVESLTVQALPDPPRRAAIARVAGMVAPGGTLLVVAAAHTGPGRPYEGPPWPLTRDEVMAFTGGGLRPVRTEEITDAGQPGVTRWRAEFHRPEPEAGDPPETRPDPAAEAR